MNYRSLVKSWPLLPLAGLSACAIFGGGSTGIARVDDLVGWIERVHVESELSKEKSRLAIETLSTLTSPDFEGDPVAVYTSFVRSIETSEAQAAELRSAFDAMRASAEPVFEQWSDDLLAFSNAALRQRSQARMADTRQRYSAIVAAVEPTLPSYDAFNMTVRDHALFLGHDFNASAVSAIAQDVQALNQMAVDLEVQLDGCLEACQAYLEAAARPMQFDSQAGPEDLMDERDSTERAQRPLGASPPPGPGG